MQPTKKIKPAVSNNCRLFYSIIYDFQTRTARANFSSVSAAKTGKTHVARFTRHGFSTKRYVA